jgi:hypothetical protein
VNSSGQVYAAATTTFSGALTYSAGNVTCNTASGSQAGCLSSTDWTLFNNKVSSSSLASSITAAFPFTPTALGNSTSTLLQLTAGFISSASSTIGNGTLNGGLTISGAATSTTPAGSAYGFVQTNGTVAVGSWVGTDGSGSVSGQYGTRSNHPLGFFTNDAAAQVWLTTGGSWSIGSTTPAAKLSVQGSGLISGDLSVAGLTATGTVRFASLNAANCDVKASTNGTLSCGTDTGAFPFTPTALGNSTSTLLQLTAGFISSASSTIGDGTQVGGLTISGGATTTGDLNVPTGRIVIGPIGAFDEELMINAVGGSSDTYLTLTNSGNTYKVGVESDQNFYITDESDNPYLSISNTGSTTIGMGTATTGLTINGGATTTGNMYIAGTVGVGTTSPVSTLSVTGSGYLTGSLGLGLAPAAGVSGGLYLNRTSGDPFIALYENSAAIGQIRGDSTANKLYISDSTGGASYFTVLTGGASAGNVGIGTTSPTYTLSVEGSSTLGNIARAGYFIATSTTASTFPFASTTAISGTMSQFTTASSTNLYVSSVLSSLLKTDASGLVSAAVAGTDYATPSQITSAFPFTPTTAFGSAANATSTLIGFTNGIYSLASSTIGGGTQTSGLTINGGATTTGNAYFAGNVGIQTTNPTTALHVVGTEAGAGTNLVTGLFGHTSSNSGGSTIIRATSPGLSTGVDFEANSCATGTFRYGTYCDVNIVNGTTGGSFGGINLVTNETTRLSVLVGGNVGIGTTSPWGRVSVDTSNLASNSIPSFVVGSSTRTDFVINQAGRVGINAPTPSARLDVRTSGAGNVAMRLIADSFETAFRLSENSTFSNVDFSAVSGGSLRIDNDGYVVFNHEGNFGIGTTTPGSRLSVQKNYGNTGSSLFTVASSTSSNGDTATTYFTVTDAGKVGIRTTGPAAYLAVNATGVIGSANQSAYDIAGGQIAAGNSIYSYGSICTVNSSGACTGNNGVVIGGSNTNAYTNITSSGSSFFGGNLSVGSTTPTAALASQKKYGSTVANLFLVASSTASNGSTAVSALVIPSAGNVKVGIGAITTASGFGDLYIQDDLEVDGLVAAAGTDVLCIDANGTVSRDTTPGTTVCGGATSDIRLKDNIEALGGSLERIMQVNPRVFDWKNPALHDYATSSAGFIAQELAEIFPELVGETECREGECELTGGEKAKTVNVNGPEFIAHMVSAIQEINLNVQALASTTATSTPAATAFAESFFNNLFAKVTTWLADAGNGIADLFATTITAETVYAKQLCLTDENGETCVTKTQLDALLSGSSAPSYTPPAVEPPPSDDSGTTTPPVSEPLNGDTGTTTPTSGESGQAENGGGSSEEDSVAGESPTEETPAEETTSEESSVEEPPAPEAPVEESTPEPAPESTPEPSV